MIEYRMMDETSLLCWCVHGGPVAMEELRGDAPVGIESEAGVAPGSVAKFLGALCRVYGSCAVLAIDGDKVVGKVRFYPKPVFEELNEDPCLQQVPQVRAIAAVDTESLVPKESLSPKALRTFCYQVADGHEEAAEAGTSAYRGRGIATGMLKTLIEWARAEGWEEIHSSASRSIPPLMSWIGCLGVDSYLRLGFEVTSERCNESFKEGVISQRQGHHGEAIKAMWEPFADLSEDDAARQYLLLLKL